MNNGLTPEYYKFIQKMQLVYKLEFKRVSKTQQLTTIGCFKRPNPNLELMPKEEIIHNAGLSGTGTVTIK
jgi:hypothetical protein